MIIQLNSDKTIAVDARLAQFVEGEVERVLGRFEAKLTRVEVHVSDVDGRTKSGKADKRCMVEARPAGAQPVSASANAPTLASAVNQALHKAQRLLTSAFGRIGKSAVATPKPVTTKKKAAPVAKKAAVKKAAVKKAVAKKAAPAPAVKLPYGQAPKKRIYQARRKSWPAR